MFLQDRTQLTNVAQLRHPVAAAIKSFDALDTVVKICALKIKFCRTSRFLSKFLQTCIFFNFAQKNLRFENMNMAKLN